MATTTFKNPVNGYTEKVSGLSILWALLFGWFYFLIVGLWPHALIEIAVAVTLGVMTGGPGALLALPIWIVYAFFTPKLLATKYKRAGWVEVA